MIMVSLLLAAGGLCVPRGFYHQEDILGLACEVAGLGGLNVLSYLRIFDLGTAASVLH